MSTFDMKGRPWARLGTLKPGDTVEVDGDFTCLPAGARREVKRDPSGDLYIDCADGVHGLDGQLTDDPGHDALIGVYRVGGQDR